MNGKKLRLQTLVLSVLTALLCLAYLVPFLLVLVNSFKERLDIVRNPIALPKVFSLDNFRTAFETMKFPYALFNSTLITVVSVTLIVAFSSMLAYYLVRWKSKMSTVIFMTLVSSMIMPFQALMIPFISIYGNLNLLNSKWMLCFYYLGFGLALAAFMYHGFIKKVPKELEEAALIDGATRARVFWQVVFPILAPISTTIIILDVLWIWNDFLLPSLVLISENNRTLPLSTYYFFGKYTSNYGVAMAGLVLSIIPVMIFYLLMQRTIIKGVMEGAIKS